MKTLVTILLLLACAKLHAANPPGNGFYLAAEREPARPIKSNDGRLVYLGDKQSLKIQECWLSSTNNENSRFYLSVAISYNTNVGPSTYILIVDGKAYRQTGSGATSQKVSYLSFYISGKENAEQISRYLNTPVLYRKHPGHQLDISFIPEKTAFNIGEDVTVTLRIVNIGSDSICFIQGGRNRGARDNQFIFSARHNEKQVDDIGTSLHFGGIAIKRILKPGEVFEKKIRLSKWFAFDQPGIYTIHGSYYLEFKDPNTDSYHTI